MSKATAWGLVTWLGLPLVSSLGAQPPFEEFSCSAFPANMSEASLIERFGQANVKREPIWGSDDGPQDGTVIFDGTARKLDVVWWDSATRDRLAWVRSREPNSPWRTPNGVYVGMELREIERLNGWPFRLRGLVGPEGLGIVKSWGNGRLRVTEDQGCRIAIALQPSGERRIDPAIYRQVERGEFSSGHPAMQTINPRVRFLSLTHRLN